MNPSNNTTPDNIKTEVNASPETFTQNVPESQSIQPQTPTKEAVKYDWPMIIAILGSLTGFAVFNGIAMFGNDDPRLGGANPIDSHSKFIEIFITGDTKYKWAIDISRICFVLLLIAGLVAFIKSKKQK